MTYLLFAQVVLDQSAVAEFGADGAHPFRDMLVQNVLPGLMTALSAFATAAFAMLGKYLHERAAQNKAAHAGAVVADLAAAAVAKFQVDVVPGVKARIADGSITAAQGFKELRDGAVAQVKSQAAPEVLKAASKLAGAELDSWIAGKVEIAHAESEVVSPAAVVAPVSPQ